MKARERLTEHGAREGAQYGILAYGETSNINSTAVAATGLTVRFILPYNRKMKEGITDEVELQHILQRWMSLNRVRVGLWTVQWLAMAVWFAGSAAR